MGQGTFPEDGDKLETEPSDSRDGGQSDFYMNSSSIIDGKITYHMFSETDNVEHARLKRPVVRHYSVPSVLAMEPHMDKVISDFLGHLQKRYVEPKKVCEFGEWLGYCKS
jgi:hypothetical protein